jgi:dolichol kinase
MANKINHLELKRKIAHILFGIFGLFLLTYNLMTSFQLFLILVVGLFVSLLSLKIRVPLISWFLDNFERDKDKNRLPGRGIIFVVVGSLLALQLFEKNIALASITILVFADPVSHLIGKVFGKTKSPFNETKNIEGHIAGAIISSLMAMFFVHPVLAFSGAIIAMLFESLIIEIQKIQLDDNLIIPLAAGTAMFLIKRFLFV